MSAAISELQTNEKPTTGAGIVQAVGKRYGDDAKLNELVATLGVRSDLLRTAISILEGADPQSLLARLDRGRDRVSRGLHEYLSGLAELTEEEPEVADAAAALLGNWFPEGLALTRDRHADQTEATHGILMGAAEGPEKQQVAATKCDRFVGPLGRIQVEFDSAAAAKPADARKLADLREAVEQAEERWDAGYLSLVAGIK
ncbi:MAG: hypothetical protein QME96_18995, partial [Myxococcota bacterium]|nr:hypothetical protein [Myxococcota bacterium]